MSIEGSSRSFHGVAIAGLLAGLTGGAAAEDNYCDVASSGEVVVSRPQAGEAGGPIDDVNWFARPVPNSAGDYIVAFASHNQNYLYNLTTGQRVAMPDKSDAVAMPVTTLPRSRIATRRSMTRSTSRPAYSRIRPTGTTSLPITA